VGSDLAQIVVRWGKAAAIADEMAVMAIPLADTW